MTNIMVVIWSVDPRNNEWAMMSLDERLEKVTALIKVQFDTERFTDQYNKNNKQLSGIFILPEYALSNTNSDSHLFDKDVKDKINLIFEKIKIPGLLIIPGTIPYKSQLTAAKRSKIQESVRMFSENEAQKYGNFSDALQKIVEPLPDQLMKEEYNYYSKNSAYAFYHDKEKAQKLKVSKREDLTDDYYNSIVFIPGVSNPTFHCMGYNVGISICRDSMLGYLSQYDEKVDIEVVLSDYIQMSHILKNFTYPHMIVHAATNSDHSGVINQDGVVTHPITNDLFEGHTLSTYSISMPSISMTYTR